MLLSVLYIILSGIALPMGGIQMQKMWHNQLGDVYSVGLGSAACLGGALAAMMGWSIPVGAYLICLLA
ncbi:MAG: iron chelate uptake ABC transporter family permease subunit, partial [Bacteroidales bacterium]|nr:iron chelate uptake ABC transporter family permease subunit [Bacteroidales bacterium]